MNRVRLSVAALAAFALAGALPLAAGGTEQQGGFRVREYPVPAGSRPHDVAPARDGGVWYTAQGSGELGWLNPRTGRVREVPLGPGSAPHGVIVGPDGAPWITDGGLNAIVRVEPRTRRVRRFPLPAAAADANLNTATFDRRGVLWFTGQRGIVGRLDPKVGRVRVFSAPRGEGPYGITTTPRGSGLLRVARRELRRPDRHAQRSNHGSPASETGAGRAPGLVRLPRPHLDQRVERGQAGCVRPGEAALG